MKIRLITQDYSAVNIINRSELTAYQERAYAFGLKMLRVENPFLRIEARSRLGVNKLCFSDPYHRLDPDS